MNKEEFIEILQSALLNYDGIDYKELVEKGLKPELVKAGIKLCEYLKGD
tara:strand:+ start:162 stop:308 length:147 start_codon:yes stop_codon:yes gene_type:complete